MLEWSWGKIFRNLVWRIGLNVLVASGTTALAYNHYGCTRGNLGIADCNSWCGCVTTATIGDGDGVYRVTAKCYNAVAPEPPPPVIETEGVTLKFVPKLYPVPPEEA